MIRVGLSIVMLASYVGYGTSEGAEGQVGGRVGRRGARGRRRPRATTLPLNRATDVSTGRAVWRHVMGGRRRKRTRGSVESNSRRNERCR
jgi:hypothetical protein